MGKYNAAIEKLLPRMPSCIKALPVSDEGYPVPWFVPKMDGKWNFVAVVPGKPIEAHRRGICWVCGGRMGSYASFVIGPMCAINRVSSEPPSHKKCAEFAALACPFLTRPRMRRNEKVIPKEYRDATPGIPLDRNPGVVLVWTTLRRYRPFRSGQGYLFQFGDPTSCSWWCEGREASRDEVMHSIETGLPFLADLAKLDGPQAEKDLGLKIRAAMSLVPA